MRRSQSISHEAFHQYWKQNHGDLMRSVAGALGASRYVQSHTIDSLVAKNGNRARGSSVEPYDGIAEVWWESESDMRPAGYSKEELVQVQKRLLEDERKFIDVENSVVFLTEEYEIFNQTGKHQEK